MAVGALVKLFQFARKPIKRKRSRPRRGDLHDRPYLKWMHTHQCLIKAKGFDGCSGRITVHHVKECPGAPKNDHRTLTLCQGHHQKGFRPDAIHNIGNGAFEAQFDLVIEDEIANYRRLWAAKHSGERHYVPIEYECA